jgi:cell division protein ZapA
MNIVTVKINGIEYNLKGEEKEEYLHKVAAYVDRKIKSISGTNSKLSTTSAAVLTAVNVVDEMFKYERSYTKLELEVERLTNSERLLNEQLENQRRQIQHMEDYNQELQNKIKNSSQEELIKEKNEQIESMSKEMQLLQESAQKQIIENNNLKADNKELKFQLQSAKYKIIGLQNKLIENQIDLVKVKKTGNPLLNVDK